MTWPEPLLTAVRLAPVATQFNRGRERRHAGEMHSSNDGPRQVSAVAAWSKFVIEGGVADADM
jgi:hypothetical protein